MNLKKNDQIISFDIGSSNMKVLVGNSKDGQIFIERYDIIPIPEDTIFDGKIYHRSKLAEILKKYMKEYKIKTKNIWVTISSSETILRSFELPRMKDKELKQAIKYEIEYLLPETIDNYVVDFNILQEYQIESQEEQVDFLKVQAVALPKSIAMTYLETFEKAGLKILVIDIQPNNMAKLFGGRKKLIKPFKDQETIDQNIAIIDIGNQNTSITVLECDKVFLNRVIHKGGANITRLICETYEMDFNRAEEWKKNNDILNQDINKELSSVLEEYIKELIVEINKILDFFISRSKEKKLDRIYLIGGSAKIKNIDRYFQNYTHINTALGNDYKNINFRIEDKSFKEDMLYLCNNIGILLRKE